MHYTFHFRFMPVCAYNVVNWWRARDGVAGVGDATRTCILTGVGMHQGRVRLTHRGIVSADKQTVTLSTGQCIDGAAWPRPRPQSSARACIL